MSQAGGASSEQMCSAGGQPLGTGLRCVRRRCAPAHSAAPGPQRLQVRNGKSNCRWRVNRDMAEREI